MKCLMPKGKMIKEAMLYHGIGGDMVVCDLCNHRCRIVPEKYGICGVRQNRKGKLYTHAYGELIAAHIDPIEKKPLFHFLPGTLSFSMATAGCNFRCAFCQNWQISQRSAREQDAFGRKYLPYEIVASAKKQGCQSISYTYTEPTIFFEYAYETAKLAKAEGIANVFVTNGFITKEALDTINGYLDACNVDLKSFRENYYRDMCQAHFQPVVDTIRYMKTLNIWIEITTLVVPEQNDSDQELDEIARFIADVDPEIPWHISRFHPDYQYQESAPTPITTLRRAYDIGKNAGLRYIYIGNVWGESEDTLCPACARTVIRRQGFSVTSNSVENGLCSHCGRRIAGIFY